MKKIECCSNDALYELIVTKNEIPHLFKKLSLSDLKFENIYFNVQSAQYVFKRDDQYWSLKRTGDRLSLDAILDKSLNASIRPLVEKDKTKNTILSDGQMSFIRSRSKSSVHEYTDSKYKVLVNKNKLAVGPHIINLTSKICSCIILNSYAYASLYDSANKSVQHIACCNLNKHTIEWFLNIQNLPELWFQKATE